RADDQQATFDITVTTPPESWWIAPRLIAADMEGSTKRDVFDFSGYDGLEIDLALTHFTRGTLVHVQLVEANRSVYRTIYMEDAYQDGPHTVRVMFDDFTGSPKSAADYPNFALDLDQVAAIDLVLWTGHAREDKGGDPAVNQPGHQCRIMMRDVRLVKY
ncbi:MAG: hypothetical protein JXB13_09615, partial [Phycisphaerae bacterium]|nr:hypothetical protein [Phycisphaerae bacterium]